jgi:hypothetical protein
MGFTTGSRGEVPRKRKHITKEQNNNNNNNNTVPCKQTCSKITTKDYIFMWGY